MRTVYYPSNWQRCYQETLKNLKEELHQQRIRRHYTHDAYSSTFKPMTVSENSELSILPGSLLHNFQGEQTSSPVMKNHLHGFISRKHSLKEHHNNEVPAMVDTGTQPSTISVDEESALYELGVKEQCKEEGSAEEDDNVSSHWSNSEISVSKLDSSLDDFLQKLRSATNTNTIGSLVEKQDKEKNKIQNAEIKETKNKDHSLKAMGISPQQSLISTQEAQRDSQLAIDIQETWKLMNALRRKISDVRSVIDLNI
eukprot:g1468.t1